MWIHSILTLIFREHRRNGLWFREEQEMFIPRKIDPTVTNCVRTIKRLNKAYTPGRRVRGDVAI